MKERPMLFSAPMVRAILAGTKTQTRRVFKVRGPMGNLCQITSPDEEVVRFDDGTFHYLSTSAMSGPYPCPYGAPGDRLWVRETWNCYQDHGLDWDPKTGRFMNVFYRATDEWADDEEPIKYRPSIHMPRWASRITLEVTGVRVDRLQDISSVDALAEGISRETAASIGAKLAYKALWTDINGPGSWDANPWVWVVEFKRISGQGDGQHG